MALAFRALRRLATRINQRLRSRTLLTRSALRSTASGSRGQAMNVEKSAPTIAYRSWAIGIANPPYRRSPTDGLLYSADSRSQQPLMEPTRKGFVPWKPEVRCDDPSAVDAPRQVDTRLMRPPYAVGTVNLWGVVDLEHMQLPGRDGSVPSRHRVFASSGYPRELWLRTSDDEAERFARAYGIPAHNGPDAVYITPDQALDDAIASPGRSTLLSTPDPTVFGMPLDDLDCSASFRGDPTAAIDYVVTELLARLRPVLEGTRADAFCKVDNPPPNHPGGRGWRPLLHVPEVRSRAIEIKRLATGMVIEISTWRYSHPGLMYAAQHVTFDLRRREIVERLSGSYILNVISDSEPISTLAAKEVVVRPTGRLALETWLEVRQWMLERIETIST